MAMLTKELESAQKDAINARGARDSLLKDQELHRSIAMREEGSKEELMRYIMQLENHRDILETQLSDLQKELSLQRERRENDRQRYYELEQIVNQERIGMQYVPNDQESSEPESENLQSTIKKQRSYIERRSESLHNEQEEEEEEEEGEFTYEIETSQNSVENVGNVNLDKIINQLNDEVESCSQQE